MLQANRSTSKSHGGLSTFKVYRACVAWAAQSPNKDPGPGGGSNCPRHAGVLQEGGRPDVGAPGEMHKTGLWSGTVGWVAQRSNTPYCPAIVLYYNINNSSFVFMLCLDFHLLELLTSILC